MKSATTFSSRFIKVCLVLMFPFSVSAQDATWFTDVSAQLGFNVVHAGAVIGLDVNNDNYPDLITLFGDSGWKLYINQDDPSSTNPKDRRFVDATAGSGLDQVQYKQLASAADFNNDGNIDLVTNYWYHDLDGNCQPNPDLGYRCHLLLGNGQGQFTLKANSGLEAIGPVAGTGLPTLDFDKDGNLDLYIATHYTSWCGVPQANYLMKGNGDGTFTNVSNASGINVSQQDPAKPWLAAPTFRSLFGANVADWNNDCNLDVITAPYESTGYNFTAINGQYPTAADTQNTVGYGNLLRNNGNGTFTDVGATANYNPHYLWGDNGQGAVPWAAMPYDYDNDGDIDFLVLLVHGGNDVNEARTSIFTNQGPSSNYALLPEPNRITRKNPQSSHMGDHNGVWTDFDNDGLVDLVIGNSVYMPNTDRMFFCRQDATHQFTDITKELGFITGVGASTISNRIRRPSVMIPFDYDMDGDDDILKTAYNADDSLNFLVLRNNVADTKNFITIKLDAPSGVNKSSIGARVTVKAGNLRQMREIYGGQGSWTNQYPFIMNFGLENHTMIDSIIVRWPNATCSQTVVTNIPSNAFIQIGANGVTNLENVREASGFKLYPNPAGDVLNLEFKNNLAPRIEVFNAVGQKIMDKSEAKSNRFTLSLQELQDGFYWVRVSDGSSTVMTKSFVKIKR